MPIRLVFLGILLLQALGIVSAEECVVPTQELKSSAIVYVGKRFHVQPERIHITSTEKAYNSCFWELTFRTLEPVREMTLYLSPDHRYLTSELYDLSADPLAAERAAQTKNSLLLNKRVSPVWGSLRAPITIVEFSDFQCPYCKRMADTLSVFMGNQSESGDVKILYRSFPLPIHAWAERAAITARCVELLVPKAFWRYHQYIFERQGELSMEAITESTRNFLAQEQVPSSAFQECVSSPATLEAVNQDRALGSLLGVNETPTLFINGRRLSGALTGSELKDAVRVARQALGLPASVK